MRIRSYARVWLAAGLVAVLGVGAATGIIGAERSSSAMTAAASGPRPPSRLPGTSGCAGISSRPRCFHARG